MSNCMLLFEAVLKRSATTRPVRSTTVTRMCAPKAVKPDNTHELLAGFGASEREALRKCPSTPST